MKKTSPTFDLIKNISFFTIVFIIFQLNFHLYLFNFATSNGSFEPSENIKDFIKFIYFFFLMVVYAYVHDLLLNFIYLKKIIKLNKNIILLLLSFLINIIYFNFLSLSFPFIIMTFIFLNSKN